jgi:hypothetical protein
MKSFPNAEVRIGDNVYLSTPYSHPNEKIRRRRFQAANRAAFDIMRKGRTVFSPISHSHIIEGSVDERMDHEFWMAQDLPYLTDGWADALVLIKAVGWRESTGVAEELKKAKENGIKAYQYDPLPTLDLVGISGKKRSGKDTMARWFAERGFEQFALADPIKESCQSIFGFSEEQVGGDRKEEEDPYWERTPREVMQHFGTDAFRGTYGDDVWVRSLMQRLRFELPPKVVVSDVRFPNEVEGIQRVGGQVIRIDASERLDHEDDHASETALDGYHGFDHVVKNNGTLKEFKKASSELIDLYEDG